VTQNPKTDTEEIRGKLGRSSGRGERKDAQEGKKGHTEEQIVAVLRQVEAGARVEEVCHKAGISEATYYLWKRQYSGVGVSELRELRQLREENGRLKRLVADLSMDRQILQEIVSKKL
jgi:putative transposase